MSALEATVLRHLSDRLAAEIALGSDLRTRLTTLPAGGYRVAVELHLSETLGHAERVRNRLIQLGWSSDRPGLRSRMAGAVAGRTSALASASMRRRGGADDGARILDDATDHSAAVARDIAAYVALARLARGAEDERTTNLAAEHLADEQRMFQRLLTEVSELARTLIPVPEPVAEPVVHPGVAATTAAAKRSERSARATRRPASLAPRYDTLSTEQVLTHLGDVSQVDLARLADHERAHHNRATILARIAALRGSEPWLGYDALNVDDVRIALGGASRERLDTVHTYERDHKNRETILKVAAG